MSKKAFDKIAAGLNGALEIAGGNAKPSKLYVPPEISVREIRKKLNLSQDDSAAEFGFTDQSNPGLGTGPNPAAWRSASILDAYQERSEGRIAASTQQRR